MLKNTRWGIGLFLAAFIPACTMDNGSSSQQAPIQPAVETDSVQEALTAGVFPDYNTGVVTINGTANADAVSVNFFTGDTDRLVVKLNGVSTVVERIMLPGARIDKIVFNGGDGNDNFANSTSLDCDGNGGYGDDFMMGGSGVDYFVGSLGNDTLYGMDGNDILWGSGGDDKLYGGEGNDSLYGHGGIDYLYGENGADLLNGGSSNDVINGGYGQDTIITVGLGADTITGGPQFDYMWVDSSDTVTDASDNERNIGYLHTISSFYSVSYNGGSTSTPVALDPYGEDLPDPNPIPGTESGLVKQDYSDRPLFRATGPNKNDAFQGYTTLGDCYFISTLSALADTDPEHIRNTVVALGDGTYAVRFYRNGAPVYVRVDGELWVRGNALEYARMDGIQIQGGGAIWVPIVEKAFAIFRRDLSRYDSIASGDGLTEATFNSSMTRWSYPDGHTSGCDAVCQNIISWVNAGSPSGAMKTQRDTNVDAFLAWAQAQRAAGKGINTGSVGTVSDTTPLVADNFRRGAHIYTIDRVLTDARGNRVGIVLRDPWGAERTLRNFTQIYFLVGGGGAWNTP